MLMRYLRGVAVLLMTVGPGAAVAQPNATAPSAMPSVVQQWRTFTTRDGLPNNSVQAIHVEGDHLWVGTDAGLAVRQQGKWRSWTQTAKREGEPLSPIVAIDVDSETGDAWLGTWGGGVLRLTAGRFDHFDQLNSGLAGDLVFDLVVARGKVWVATNGGVNSYDPVTQQWALHLERRAGPSQVAVTSLGVDRGGATLSLGAWCGRLWQLDLRTLALSPDAGPPGGLPITGSKGSKRRRGAATALYTGSKTLWWTSQDRLYRRGADGAWDVRMIEAGLRPTDFVQCIAARDGEELWLGTDRGLCVLTDAAARTWVSYRLCETSGRMVTGVYREGRLLCSMNGAPGLGHNRVRCIAVAGDDVWIGTSRGLTRGSGRSSWVDSKTASMKAPPPTVAADAAADARPRAAGSSKRFVPIGVLMPVNKTLPVPGKQVASLGRVDLRAVQLAVEDANKRGGYRGSMPYQIERDMHGYERYGWHLLEDELITASQMAGVRGLVGSIGPGRRITTACLVRSEVPVVNVAATPATVDEAVTPWLHRCPKDGRTRIEELAGYLFSERGIKRPAVLRIRDSGGSPLTDAFSRLAKEQGGPLVLEDEVAPGGDAPGDILKALREKQVDCVVSFCGTEEAAWIVRSLRGAGLSMPFVGGGKIVRHDFGSLAGGAPGAVIALWGCPSVLGSDGKSGVAARYRRKFKINVQIRSFRDYQATSHLLWAIDLAGLDRGAIRETLASIPDANMARLERGRWRFGRPRPCP